MLNPIIIMGERATCVVRRIDIDALHLPRKLLFQRFEGEEVVAEDEAVVEEVTGFV